MNTESLAQPRRNVTSTVVLEELAGELDVPAQPIASAGSADVYQGVWTSEKGVSIPVAVKQLRILTAKDRSVSADTLEWKLYTVMSEKAPFQGFREPYILFRVMNEQPPKPEDHVKLPASDPLWSLMRSCWQNNPNERPSIQQVARELLEAVSSEISASWSKIHANPTLFMGGYESQVSEFDISDLTLTGGFHPHVPHEMALLLSWKLFKALEVASNILSLFRGYVEALAGLGLLCSELVQAMDCRGAVTKTLCYDVRSLALSLAPIKRHPGLLQESNREEALSNIEKMVQQVCRSLNLWHSAGLNSKVLPFLDDEQGVGYYAIE
ncbi:hypothetical protein FRB90_002079 [Tulasnella sp. 427]|nr:hypothetical protein FRB90_002079 [Tulasnella sp. 427]